MLNDTTLPVCTVQNASITILCCKLWRHNIANGPSLHLISFKKIFLLMLALSVEFPLYGIYVFFNNKSLLLEFVFPECI